METKDEVQFYTEQDIKVDYSKSTSNVFNQLSNIYYNESTNNKKNKIKFLNAQHPTTEYTWDFHLNKLSSDKFEVYKVESLVKDVDWYAAYYAKFHKDEKEIYKKQTVSKEDQKRNDDWLSNQPLSKEIKKILKLSNYDPTSPAIESYKSDVNLHGFIHGYYLKAV